MSSPGPLGLPDSVRACLFDLDGVLTKTATVHMAAWKRTFDEFLRAHEPGSAEFSQLDYNRFVDGKPRADGVRDFLASRGITLPEGAPGDPADAATVQGIASRKNVLVLDELEQHGVEVYPGSVTYLKAVKDAGFATAVVTASANGEQVIAAGGFADLIDARVDGAALRERDAAAGQEAANAVGAVLAVHVTVVVQLAERLLCGLVLPQEPVEGPLPRGEVDGRRLGEDAVEVEQADADGVRETEHGSTLTARGPADLSRPAARREEPG